MKWTKKDMFGIMLIGITLIVIVLSHAYKAPGQLSPYIAIILIPSLIWFGYFELKIIGNWKKVS